MTHPLQRLMAATAVDESTGCWRCTIGRQANGYAHLQVGAQFVLVHRLAWEALHGRIPEGHTIDHVAARGCAHRDCWNPSHLEPVTRAENIRRGGAPSAVAVRTDRCSRGHRGKWVPNGRGKRTCGACLAERRRP